MKTILPILLLTSLGLAAQIPPPPAPPAADAKSAQEIPALPNAPTEEPAALKRLIPLAARGPTAPPVAATAAPASGAGGVPAPGAAAAPTLPAAPAAPTTAVNPAPAAPTAPGAPGAAESPLPVKAPVEQTIPPGFINWVGADLNSQVLPIYAEMVGRSILRPAALPAAIIVFKNQTELTKREAIQAIDAVLALNGIAMINVGDKFVKAVPMAQANMEGAAFNQVDAEHLPELGQYVTHIVQLQYIKTSEALAVIQPFAKIPNAVIPIESSQMLVLRDNTENVKRMLEMIKKVDVTVPSEFVSEVIPIKFAKVADISAALNSLSGGGGTTVGSRAGGARATGAPGMNTGARPGQPGYTPGATTPGALGSPAGTPSSGASFSDRIRNIISRAASPGGASGDLQIIGVTKVVADERSNSLLIFATRQDMAMIKDIVSKLDVVLAQVLIETVIIDVSLSDTHSLGVSYLQQPKAVGNKFTGIGALNNVGFLGPGSFSALTNGVSALGQGFSYFGRFNQDLDVTLTAIANDTSVKVIQKPRIMTSHATPATVFIGNTVPYVSGTYYGGGYGGGPSSSYQQLRVGINLSVTPFINQDGLVVMQIDEAIDELGKPVPITGVGNVPSTVSRTLSAEVAVRDRETIVLGGFIRSSGQDRKDGVPILKDIPLLGWLFNNTSKTKERSELLVLMRPTVLRTPEIAAAYTTEEKSRLPGVRRAEAENEAYETKRVKQADRDLGTPGRAEEATPVKNEEKKSERDAQGFLQQP